MILFLDTDSICKRYLDDEENVIETGMLVPAADILASSIVAYVEVRGVLARARRGRRIRSARAYSRVLAEFETDWEDFVRVDLSGSLVGEAGRLAEKHFLTGLDAIQLACAMVLEAASREPVKISTWDRRSGLIDTALAEGLALDHEVPT